MLELGADIRISAGQHGSVLGSAARRRNLTLCKYLLDAGAITDLKDNMERAPLVLATVNGHVDIVKLLIVDLSIRPFLGLRLYMEPAMANLEKSQKYFSSTMPIVQILMTAGIRR